MKPVLIDSSSAILLFKVDLFDTLLTSYRLLITEAVYTEITLPGYPGAGVFRKACRNDHLTVIPSITDVGIGSTYSPALTALGSGERDTILAYGAENARFIIIDDGRGSAYCKSKGVPYVNALLIVRILFFAEKLSESGYRQKLAAIMKLGRYSQEIIQYGCNCSKRSLADFMP